MDLKEKLIQYAKNPVTRLSQLFRHKFYVPLILSYDRFGDLKRGINTQELISTSDLGFSSSIGNHYEAARYSTLRKFLKLAQKKGYSSLLDIGCGYGRPLIVAKELGFLKLYGVDISQKLIDNCFLNLKKLNIEANLVCCDVDKYSSPNEDLVIFIFNSLKEDRLSSLIDKLKKRKNKCLFIYANPKYKNLDLSDPIYVFSNKHFGMYEEDALFFEIN